NREINNMSTISEKSIIETITQNNITTKLLNIFGWNKQPQNYNEQFRFQYQQLQNQFNNQYQLMHNQYQSLLQQQVHNQQMKTQKTTNQDLTQHLINPHRNINNQNQYTNTNTVQPQTSQTQNTHNRVNLNSNRINNNNIKANLIKEIRKFKGDICIRNAYINDKNELIIITGKEEDQLKINEEWPTNAFENGITLCQNEQHTTKKRVYYSVIRGVRRNLEEEEIKDELENEYGIKNIVRIMDKDKQRTTLLKVSTEDETDHIYLLKNGIYFNNRPFTVEEYRYKPIVCYKCSTPGHMEYIETGKVKKCLTEIINYVGEYSKEIKDIIETNIGKFMTKELEKRNEKRNEKEKQQRVENEKDSDNSSNDELDEQVDENEPLTQALENQNVIYQTNQYVQQENENHSHPKITNSTPNKEKTQ
ncbi:hypothetical protein BpHYR1_047826, partial [Brachionus plicatilis]